MGTGETSVGKHAFLTYSVITMASLGASVLLRGIKCCTPKSLTEHLTCTWHKFKPININ